MRCYKNKSKKYKHRWWFTISRLASYCAEYHRRMTIFAPPSLSGPTTPTNADWGRGVRGEMEDEDARGVSRLKGRKGECEKGEKERERESE